VSSRFSTVGSLVLEAGVVVLAGAALAFGANAVSPSGLTLQRNYFPDGTTQGMARVRNSGLSVAAADVAGQPGLDAVDQRLKDKGLQPVSRAKTEELFRDPRFQEGLIVFVDARNPAEYGDGHIPGSCELDPYHPEQRLADVLARCQAADQVVVYCDGGDCEDADSTAILLRDAGVAKQKLLVYGGGYTEWRETHLPVEQGAPDSSSVTGPAK
jgi:rhodanese-related sulfurtransferase